MSKRVGEGLFLFVKMTDNDRMPGTMLVGIISDSHDHLDNIERAMQRFEREEVSRILHPGDIVAPFAARLLQERCLCPLDIIYGKNDGERDGLAEVFPEICDGPVMIRLGDLDVAMDHYPPSNQHPPLDGARVILFGHTHQIVNEDRDGILFLNPGESCGWVTGKATVAVLETVTLKV